MSNSNSAPKPKYGNTRVIGIVSGKGGVGKTTFSANIGIALKAFGFKTLVIDCNVTTPHLSYYIGARNYSTTINNIFSGDIDAIFAPLDKNGLMFIPASERFEDLENVDMKQLKKIIERIASTDRFDFIILDSAPGLGREAMGALQACEEIVFITQPTAPNVMDVARCDEVARMLGHKKFYLVFNMVRGKEYELTPEKSEDLFGVPFLGSIPFDENVMDSTAQGVPIMWFRPESTSCDSFMEIAARLCGVNLDRLVERGREGEHFEDSISIDEVEQLDEGSLSDKLERLGSLEPIIDTDYSYLEDRRRFGTRSSLRDKIDRAAGRLARKIRGKIWR